MSAIFHRAAEKLEIPDAASEEGCRLAAIISAMRLGLDDVEKLADNAVNVYRWDRVRRLNRFDALSRAQSCENQAETGELPLSGLSEVPVHGPQNQQG